MSRFGSASDVLIMQPSDLGFYQQEPTLKPELFIQYNRMCLVERLDSDSLHAVFDNYTTKSERKKRKTERAKIADQTRRERGDSKATRDDHNWANYDPSMRCAKQQKSSSTTPNPTPANSLQNGRLLKHRHQAHENRKCACCAIVVGTKLKLVLNCKRRNGSAPPSARSVTLTNKSHHTFDRMDKHDIVTTIGSTNVSLIEVALNKGRAEKLSKAYDNLGIMPEYYDIMINAIWHYTASESVKESRLIIL